MMQVNETLMRPMCGVPLFRGLSLEQISMIARSAERIVYREGDTIIAADSEGDAAILVVSGDAVRISGVDLDGGLEVIDEGSLLGEMAMLVEMEYGSTVIARGMVRALRITREGLQELMEHDPALVDHFLHKIAGRLSDLACELRSVDQALASASEASTASSSSITGESVRQAQLH